MRSMNVKAARPAVFFLCAVLLTLAGCRVDGPDHGGIDPLARSGNPDGLPSENPSENPSDTTKPAVYTVTFNAGEGSVSPQSRSVEPGTLLRTLLPTPTRTTHTFGGWYTEQDGGGTEFTAYTPVTAHITIYANWLAKVTFDADGGSVSPSARTVKPGRSLDSLPDAAKDGYAFRGWYTAENGGGTEFTAYTPVTENITIYAKWAIQYTVTFDADGGSPGTQTRSAAAGESVGASNIPPDPEKAGYIFDGWYTGQNGGGDPFIAATPVTADIKVYAKWTPIGYTVTFDADGGSPETQTRTGHYGSPLNALSEPTKTGHTFGGWYTGQNGGGTQFTASTPVTANITVYAKWIINQYTITFNADGGTPAEQTRTEYYNTPLGSLPSEPAKTGYTFGGWYTGQNGNGPPVTAETRVTENITVYAKWTINQYTVIFNADGGTPATQTRKVNYNTPLGSLPSNPTKAGYTFGGWYTAANGGGDEFTADTLVTADITVHAKWIHTITFNAGAGSVSPSSRTVNHGSQISDPPVPTRINYAFGGWYTEQNGGGTAFTASTAVTANRTVYAWWIAPNLSSLQGFLDWLTSYAEEGGNYTYTLKTNESIAPTRLACGGKRASITLKGASTERTVTLADHGDFFIVNSKVTLTLGENLTLRGQNNSGNSLIAVEGGGTLVMNDGSKLCGNRTTAAGGGVYLRGTFIMNGGEISGNSAGQGGGVVINGGTFTMNGGTITNNRAGEGGGVRNFGTFNWNGGTIINNTPDNVVPPIPSV